MLARCLAIIPPAKCSPRRLARVFASELFRSVLAATACGAPRKRDETRQLTSQARKNQVAALSRQLASTDPRRDRRDKPNGDSQNCHL